MRNLFRFVMLRGIDAPDSETHAALVHVEPANTHGGDLPDLNSTMTSLAQRLSRDDWSISIKSLFKIIDDEFNLPGPDSFSNEFKRDEIKLKLRSFEERILPARQYVTAALKGRSDIDATTLDAACQQLIFLGLMNHLMATWASVSQLSDAKQAIWIHDWMERATLVAPVGGKVKLTAPADKPLETGAKAKRKDMDSGASVEISRRKSALQAELQNLMAVHGIFSQTLRTAAPVPIDPTPQLATVLRMLSALRLPQSGAETIQMLDQIDRAVRNRIAELQNLGELRFGQPYVEKAQPSPGSPETQSSKPGKGKNSDNLQSLVKLGIGDLLLTQTYATTYVVGEIAHIENVLAGEKRIRAFTKTSSRETDFLVSTESETSIQTDTQSTDRFETERAAESSLADTLNLHAGGSVSGTIGPVTTTASLGVSSNTSRQSSRKQASKTAQEVVSKAEKKIREFRSTQSRTITKLTIEDTTSHEVDNQKPAAKHVVGVYRWLEKVEHMQLVDYGQRLMAHLVVPEPGSYLRWLSRHPDFEKQGVLPPPTIWQATGTRPLGPDDITPHNYLTWVATYRVAEVNPPPTQFVTESIAKSLDPKTADGDAATELNSVVSTTFDALEVPAGYRAIRARGVVTAFRLDAVGGTYGYSFVAPIEAKLAIGSTIITVAGTQGSSTGAFDTVLPGNGLASPPPSAGTAKLKLPVSLLIQTVMGYALTLEIVCEVSDALMQSWRIETWEKVMTAYESSVAKASSNASSASGGLFEGGISPAEKEQLRVSEIKRASIEIMAGAVGAIDATTGGPMDESRPKPDTATLPLLRRMLYSYEDVFEWENLSWKCLDHFWGPESQWPDSLGTRDPDPDHQAFLRAGAAEVTIPIRPGFEAGFLYRWVTGKNWPGSHAPLLRDLSGIPVGAEAVASSRGSPQRAVPVPGSAWTSRLPTDLVILQDEASIGLIASNGPVPPLPISDVLAPPP